MNKFYTKDYTGQLISTRVSWKQSNKDVNEIWVDKTVVNDKHHGVAHVLGNGYSRLKLDINVLLKGQHGGEDGIKTVGQTYGCNLLYKDFDPTFLIAIDPVIVNEIANTKYWENNIVYTNVKNIIKNPGKFHLYPSEVNYNAGSLAIKLACADGHKTVYLLGFDFMSDPEDNIYISSNQETAHPRYLPNKDYTATNTKWTKSMIEIMQTYDDVEFICVNTNIKGDYPSDFLYLRNFKQVGVREYFNLAQLGAIHR
jgi:hypothetical protein